MLATRRLCKKYFFGFQVIVMILCAFVGLLWSKSHSLAFLLGAGLMIVANGVFVLRLFFHKANYHPVKELTILYLSEFMKLVVVVFGSVMIVIYLQPKLLPYILGLSVLQLAMWLMPLFMRLKHAQVTHHINKRSMYGSR